MAKAAPPRRSLPQSIHKSAHKKSTVATLTAATLNVRKNQNASKKADNKRLHRHIANLDAAWSPKNVTPVDLLITSSVAAPAHPISVQTLKLSRGYGFLQGSSHNFSGKKKIRALEPFEASDAVNDLGFRIGHPRNYNKTNPFSKIMFFYGDVSPYTIGDPRK